MPFSQGCYRRHYLAWERQQQELLAKVDSSWKVPADTLQPLLNLHGYELRRAHLARGRLAEVDYSRQVVRLASDFTGRIDIKERTQEVLVSTLAHELAHVVLHRGKRPQRIHETEAWVWATMFLAPWWMVGSTAEALSIEGDYLTDRQRWARVYSLARYFGVSATLMNQALKLYGIGGQVCHGRAA